MFPQVSEIPLLASCFTVRRYFLIESSSQIIQGSRSMPKINEQTQFKIDIQQFQFDQFKANTPGT